MGVGAAGLCLTDEKVESGVGLWDDIYIYIYRSWLAFIPHAYTDPFFFSCTRWTKLLPLSFLPLSCLNKSNHIIGKKKKRLNSNVTLI